MVKSIYRNFPSMKSHLHISSLFHTLSKIPSLLSNNIRKFLYCIDVIHDMSIYHQKIGKIRAFCICVLDYTQYLEQP